MNKVTPDKYKPLQFTGLYSCTVSDSEILLVAIVIFIDSNQHIASSYMLIQNNMIAAELTYSGTSDNGHSQ